MTYPSANPGGEHNWLIRQAIKEWLDAQHISGIDTVHLTLRPVNDFPDSATSYETGCACYIFIDMADDYEDRETLVGPNNPGGKMIVYAVNLHVVHRGFDSDDWEGSQRDYNRVIDAVKDCLRARGRDLGRPDVVLQAADWPRSHNVVHQPSPPVGGDDGTVDREGVISFSVSQYLPTFVPGPGEPN